jgi:hypothetical protein
MADHDPNDTQLKRHAESWRARPLSPITIEQQMADLTTQIAVLTEAIVMLHRDMQDFTRPKD